MRVNLLPCLLVLLAAGCGGATELPAAAGARRGIRNPAAKAALGHLLHDAGFRGEPLDVGSD